MEITKALEEDHDELKHLLKTITSSSDASAVRTAFDAFAKLLAEHSKAEEQVVYEALIDTGDEDREMDAHEGYTEHMLADTLLAKLKAIEWRAEAQVMQEILTHHIKEEEHKIFRDLKRSFAHDARETMGEAFERLKAEVAV